VHPRKFIRDSLGFAATQYVIRGLLMARAIIAARLLGPLPYGAWNALQLVMDYGATLPPMGTQQGLDQAVPARIVEGDAARLESIERAGLFNILVLTVLFCGAWLLYVFLHPNRFIDFWGPSGLLLAVLAIVLTNLASYHMTLLRSHGNITAVSGWFFVQGVAGTVVGLALIPRFGAWGLLAGWTVATAAATIMIRFLGRGLVPVIPRPGPDGLSLVRVGLPMFVFVASSQVMRSIDRLIILRYLGTLALGYYSLSVMALGFMLYLPDSIAYVLYPRLLRDFRHHERRPEAIRDQVERALRVLAVLVPGLCGAAYLGAREAIALVLPSFMPGLTAVRVLCFGAGGLTLANLSSIVLMTLGRQNVLVPMAIGMTTLGAALDYVAVRYGLGINGVARMTLVTYVLNGGLLLWLACGGLRVPAAARLRLLGRALAPLLIAFVLAYGLDKALPWSADLSRGRLLGRLVAALALFVTLYGAAMSLFIRGLGLRQLVREFNLMMPRPARRARPAAEP
jgi:O-antigen/teichoic acid export membrane protein